MQVPSGCEFTECSQLKDIYNGRKERGDIYVQFLAGKCLEIVAGIISTPDVILMKNTIGGLSLLQKYLLGLDFKGFHICIWPGSPVIAIML